MSGKRLSESHVTCAICFEKYRKPQSLKCGHIFCTPCIEELFKKTPTPDTILCPKCRAPSTREDLRRDFAMQELVEILEEPGISRTSRCATTVRRNIANCDVCKEGRWAGFCEECEQYLCPPCTKLHTQIKATKDHTVLNQEYLKGPTLQLLSALQSEYKSNLKDLENQQRALSDAEWDRQTATVSGDIDNIFAKIAQKHVELNKAFRTEKLEHAMKVDKLNKSIAATCVTLQTNIELLNDVIKSENPTKLFNSEFLDKMKADFKENNAKFEKTFEECVIFDDSFRCSLFVPPALEGLIQHMFIARGESDTQVTAPPVAYGCIAQFADPGVLRHDFRLMVDDSFIKIRAIDGELWVHGLRGIHVYDANTKLVRILKIKLDNDREEIVFDDVWDSAQTSDGNIVVVADCTSNGCFEGLYHVDSTTGRVLAEVVKGRFTSLAASGHEIHAMQMREKSRSCIIVAYSYSDSKWQLFSSISLDFVGGLQSTPLDIIPTFQVHEHLIYLCDTTRVLVYTSSGAFCLSHNLPVTCPKSHHIWRLTDIDADNNMLLIEHNVNSNSGRLFIYDHNNVVTQLSVESMYDLNDACVDSQGKLWVLNVEGEISSVYRCVPNQQEELDVSYRDKALPLPVKGIKGEGKRKPPAQRPVSYPTYCNTTAL